MCVFFGDSLWNMLLGGIPQWYTDMKQNPTAVFIMIFFVAPSLVRVFYYMFFSCFVLTTTLFIYICC